MLLALILILLLFALVGVPVLHSAWSLLLLILVVVLVVVLVSGRRGDPL